MAYAVAIKPSADRELKRLPRRDQERLRERIAALAEDPRPHNAQAFKGFPHAYRVRVGDLRIVYEVDDSQRQVWIFLIGDRKDVYRRR